jgi:membrane-bound lytic murein transglycosylase F
MRPTGWMRTVWFWICIGLLCLGAMSCERELFQDDLERIKARGELIMVTRNSATTFYQGPHGETGFEYELAKAFADHLGVGLRPLVAEDEADMITTLLQGRADIAAPGFAFGRSSARLVALGPGYLEVHQQVIGHRDGPAYQHIEALVGTPIAVTSNSARLEVLNQIKASHPGFNWMIPSDLSSEELMEMVWKRSLSISVVGSNTFTLNRRIYPELVVLFNVGPTRQLAWAMDPQSRHLRRAVERWFAMPETQETLQGLIQHYYGHLEEFDYVDLALFRRAIFSRLSPYRAFFEEAAQRYGLDWRLVCAQSYQESHWQPRARSQTGVRGMMMLTLDTARIMGLKNRLDPKASIFAGTRYLSYLHQAVGAMVPEPDRTLMALAAYNIGLGHLQDARELAERLDKPANTWHGVRSVLPLLQKKKYYQSVANGYARGSEAVQYVDRIRTYHKVLTSVLASGSFQLQEGG